MNIKKNETSVQFKNINRKNLNIYRNRLLYLIFEVGKYESAQQFADAVYETKQIYVVNKTGSSIIPKEKDAIRKDIRNQLNAKDNNEYLHYLRASYISLYCKMFKFQIINKYVYIFNYRLYI